MSTFIATEEEEEEGQTGVRPGSAAARWRARLAGLGTPLELPGDRPRPRLPSSHRGRLVLPLAAGGWFGRLEPAPAGGGRETAEALLLAGVAAFCARLSGRRDLAIGVRARAPEAPSGLAVVRLRVAPEATFGELLEQVRGELRQALVLGPVPPELAPADDPSRHPLVQVGVAVRMPGEPPAAEPFRFHRGLPALNLAWTLDRAAEPPELVLDYNADLYAAEPRGLAAGVDSLLDAGASDPGLRIGALPLVPAAEHGALLRDLAVVRADYPRDAGIAELFADRVAAAPDAVAVVAGERCLSYRELDRRAGRLARRLRALGVRRSTPVAVALGHSLELIEALVAIVRAGGAYVPIDAAYPAERLAFMLDDAGAPVLITREALLERLPIPAGTAVVCMDGGAGAEPAVEEGAEAGGPWEAAGAEDLAYVTYTSGSTGRPKGVMVPQRGVVRLVREADYARFGPDETFLHLAAVTFDLTTLEVWGPLLTGGRLVVFPPEAPVPDRLADVLARERVTFLWLTAGLFHQMAEARPEGLAPVRQLLAGGDALSATHCRRVLEACPETLLIDGYGPTENTTFSSCHPMRRPEEVSDPVSIGRPIANSEAFVLDPGLEPLPVGAPGELMVGGDGLAWGYWRRPALTAERFVPHPFSDRPGDRLYHTGDLARWRPDGTLEYLGRTDHQVKLRGFRIELGEVESALAGHPGVGEVVVVARELLGGKALVAYLVPRAGAPAPTPAEFRERLAASLPEYMVPAAFVALAALPLSPNGKVDRRALPQPGPEHRASAGDHREARTALEAEVAAVWAEVLGVPRVGLRDDFFALGGHSLLAGSILSRLAGALGVEVPIGALFRSRTLEAFAAEVAAARSAGSRPEDPAAARDAAASAPMRRIAPDGPAPLALTQRGLWIFDRLWPGSAVNNLATVFRLRGELRPEVLKRCLAEVVRRHEPLRTVFTAGADGEPVQGVDPAGPPGPLALPLTDLAALPAARRERALEAELAAEAARPFDLAAAPLRLRLFRVGPEDHVLVFHTHHIVFDGWSAELLSAELRALYPAFAAGEPSPLPEPPVRYRDFALWERAGLSEEAPAPELGYWRRHLAGLPPVLDLPADRPRPRVLSHRGGEAAVRLEPALRRDLEALAEGAGATRFMALLAAFATVLGRWSGRAEVPVGTPVAGRTRPELEGLIGLFVNTVVLRCEASGTASFRQLLGRTRDETLAALAHSRMPFQRLVEELAPERSSSHHPLIQVLFASQDLEGLAGELGPGLALEARTLGSGTAKVDLTLFADLTGGGVDLRFEYSADLFDRATVERLAGHLANLLRSAVAEPDRPLAELTMLSAAERSRLLGEWPAPASAAARAASGEAGLAERFVAAAAARPEAVAVEAPGLALTYGELERRSAALARRLAGRGVGRGTPVVLALERSPEMVVATLAVVRAGGAYVPLDLDYPPERQALLVEDAGAPLVVTHSGLRERLLGAAGREVLCVDLPDAGEEEAPAPPAAEALVPEDLAYVIYTSGSTGRPKGVAVTHRGVARLVLEADYSRLGPEETFLHLSSVSFDAATLEIWGPLLTGGRLAVFPRETPSPRSVAAAAERHRATRLFLTTALFNQLAEEPGEIPNCLGHLMTGGEAASPTRFRRVLEERPGLALSNVYGPTENTTFSTHHPVPGPAAARDPLPIGRAIAGSSCWVLGPDLRPVPEGVAGELLVGGAGLARGYWRRPALTAERFVPHPFAAAPGERLYRTGDLVRWRSGGALEFLGRNDAQVKVRGFRIEPGEVEAALAAHPEVAETVVTVREVAGERALVGYYVARSASAPAAAELREGLRRRLPPYLVPAALVPLDRLPLTPNGKVDLAALPAPDLDLGTDRVTYQAPRTPLEEEIAALWREVLGVEGVGIADDFFDLGGHSLLATRVLARLGDEFGVEIPLRTLFEEPTVAGLAQSLGTLLLAEAQA